MWPAQSLNTPHSPESWPHSLHCTQGKKGALKCAERGGMSRLEWIHHLWFCGASIFPRQLATPRPAPCFALILPALNPKVISGLQSGHLGSVERKGASSGRQQHCGRKLGWALAAGGWGCGAAGLRGALMGLGGWTWHACPVLRRVSLTEPFLPGRKHCAHSAPNQI